MSLTVEKALQIEIFKECRLLTGPAGLQNEILWVNILEILDDLRHIEPGEFLITTAHGFNVESLENQKIMADLFASKRLGAMAIQTGHYLKEIPSAFVQFLKDNSIPLIQIPPEVSFKNLTRALMNELMAVDREEHSVQSGRKDRTYDERFISQLEAMKSLWRQIVEHDSPELFHMEIERMNVNPENPIMVLMLTACKDDRESEYMSAEKNYQLMREAEIKAAKFLKSQSIPFMVGPKDDSLVLLIQPGESKLTSPDEFLIAKMLYDNLKNLAPDCTIRFGQSNIHKSYKDLKQAQGEAAKAQLAAQLELLDYTNMVSFRAMNLYRLIMDIDNMDMLKGIFQETVEPLLHYDQRSGGGLMQTLRVYLQYCSLKKASEALYVHRHTLRYRLKQIEELTGFNPLLPNDHLQLNIGLHIYYYLKALNLLT